MKKRMLLILFVIIVSAGLMYLGRSLQDMNSSKQEDNSTSNVVSKTDKTDVETKTVDNKADANQDNSKSDEVGKSDDTLEKANTTEGQQNANQQPSSTSDRNTSEGSNTNHIKNTNNTESNNQTQKPDFFIIDNVSGKNILAPMHVEYNGDTVAQLTCKILDAYKITYKMSGFGNSVYFSSIGGLKERGAGLSSGWCFYVNGQKPNLGAGTYKLKKDDVLEWKYVKDGISN